MFPKNAHHHRIPSKKEFFRSQEEMFNNRLTSVTPGRPDNRALGVQLPHSLSDPRTSPLRTSRRGGEYVQFDSEPGQLPFRRTINPLDSLRSNETFFTNCIYLLYIQLDRWNQPPTPNSSTKTEYTIYRTTCWTSDLDHARTQRARDHESNDHSSTRWRWKLEERWSRGRLLFFFLLFSFIYESRVQWPVPNGGWQ